MGQTHKAEMQNAMVQDFKHQGTFQSKEQILANTYFSEMEPLAQEHIDFDDLIFSKKEPISEHRLNKRIDELKAAQAKEFSFINDFEINQELKSLTEIKEHYREQDKAENKRKKLWSMADTVYAITLYSLIVLGITAGVILESQPTKGSTIEQLADVVRLDKAAKEAFNSTVEFSQEHNTLAVNQLSRMGQAVLDLTEPSKTVKTDDTNADTLIGNTNKTTNNNGDEK